MKRLLSAALLLALAGCGPSVDTAMVSIENPGPAGVRVPVSTSAGSGGDLLYVRIADGARANPVGALEVRLSVRDARRSNARGPRIARSVLADRAAEEVVQGRPSTAVTQLAQQVARSTYCRTGPITLRSGGTRYSSPEAIGAILAANNGRVLQPNASIPSGVSGTAIPAVEMGYNGRSAIVRLRCDAPNPYLAAAPTTQPAVARRADTLPVAPAELRGYAAGRTTITVDRIHGTQAAYHAPDGTVALWYPGNRTVNRGVWEVEPLRQNPSVGVICYRYGAASYNPATRTSGGRSCEAAGTFHARTREALPGDPFRLSSGAIPFVTERGRAYSVADLSR